VTWDAPAWLLAVARAGELRDAGAVVEADLRSLALAAGEAAGGPCVVVTSGNRKVLFNRFGTPRRVAIALGLGDGAGRAEVVAHWRALAAEGRLDQLPKAPTAPDGSYVAMDPPGQEGLDRANWRAYPMSALLERRLQQAGVANVVGVWFPPESVDGAMAIVAIKQSFGGHAVQALTIAGQADAPGVDRHIVAVVDEDIDIYSLNDVLWALLTRCDPVRDMTILRETSDRSQVLIDATKPWEWKDRFAETISDSTSERVARERWGWILNPDARDPRRGAA
jgi:3-polyprenyl-4-hydroxybenzoate decarboxylase